MGTKILLVEDDHNLGTVLQEYLQIKGNFEVKLCKNGKEGLHSFLEEPYDLCILDIMMPEKDGFTLGKEIREVNSDIPLIYATAKSLIEDKTKAFVLGADDYIIKPFRIEELLLRINAVLRRRLKRDANHRSGKPFSIGSYIFNFENQVLQHPLGQQKLSSKENDLLYLLCSRLNELVSREEALLKIWKDDNYFNGRSMDVYLSKLRKYLKDDPSVEIINIHGKGFKLIVANNN